MACSQMTNSAGAAPPTCTSTGGGAPCGTASARRARSVLHPEQDRHAPYLANPSEG